MAAQVEVLDVGERSLSELAADANNELDLIAAAIGAAVDHAFAAGHVLLECRRRVPHGEFGRWLEGNFRATAATAHRYMRMAEHEEELRAAGVTSTNAAARYLVGRPHPESGMGRRRGGVRDQKLVAHAKELEQLGMRRKEIADLLGVHHHTVGVWLNPNSDRLERERQRRRSRLRSLKLAEEKRQAAQKLKAARARKDAMGRLYAAAERMQDEIAQAQREAANKDAARALSNAGRHYRMMRDEIVRALGVA